MITNQTTLNPGQYRYTNSNDGIMRDFNVDPTIVSKGTRQDFPFIEDDPNNIIDKKPEKDAPKR